MEKLKTLNQILSKSRKKEVKNPKSFINYSLHQLLIIHQLIKLPIVFKDINVFVAFTWK